MVTNQHRFHTESTYNTHKSTYKKTHEIYKYLNEIYMNQY